MWHHFRQHHFADSPLDLTAETRTVQHPPLILPALISGMMFAGLSLLASSLLALALGQRGTTVGLWIVGVGTVLGAVAGGWWVQPKIARLLDRECDTTRP